MKEVFIGNYGLEQVGQKMTATGWVANIRNHGKLAFIELRDREGLLQVFVAGDSPAFAGIDHLHKEDVISVTGEVVKRENRFVNKAIKSGQVELRAEAIQILANSKSLPFELDQHAHTGEDLRQKYRYLDLRRSKMTENLKLRHQVTSTIRDYLNGKDFLEVETPYLTKSTPEGARDFLVPSRVFKNQFYALPQSPQMLKQLLMGAGLERYYQVVRCFRDEDLRGDRQPEFTQVDMEMAFVREEDVMAELEDILGDAFAKMGIEFPAPLRKIQYWDAMDTYGSDKPDTRIGMELHDVSEVFKQSSFKLFSSAATTEGQYVKAINVKGAGTWPRSQVDKLAEVAAGFGAKGLAWVAFKEDGSVGGPITKFFSPEELEALRAEMSAEAGDLILFAVGGRLETDEILGGMRLHMAKVLDVPREGHDFLWVVNFPLFHWDEETQSYASEHQPFTLPREDELDLLDTDPLAMGSYTYDFVMDGFEAGGGGMRIHNAELQLKILEKLGFTEERAKAQFGFLMEALTFGAPPMGGFALGLDRVCMLLAGADSIRDVMAFPKTTSGSDLMSSAPSPVSNEQLKEVSLQTLPKEA